MKNMTKAELISRIQGFNQNNPNIKLNFFDFFYLIKQFLVKITLITLIIKIFKRFSILRRIWLITNTIVMSIFGISMIDIYGLSIFSAFFAEISYLTSNIITYLSNTKFYALISGILGYKIESSSTKMGSMNRTDQSSTTSKESNKIIERFSKIVLKEEEEVTEVEITEDSPIYKNKYFIYATFLLISGVAYYYFGDEIKVYTISIFEFIKTRGRGPDGGNNSPTNPETRYNSWVNLIGWNQNKTKGLNITEILDGEINLVDNTNPIAGPSTEPMDKYFTSDQPISKGKQVLTSPSLENLNTTAAETWSSSRPTSPQSTSSNSSSAIITPLNIGTNVASSSTNSFSHSEIPKSLIETSISFNDDIYYPNTRMIKPFMLPKTSGIKFGNDSNWKEYINQGILERMKYIENTFTSENELERWEANIMVDEIVTIGNSYNSLVEAYELSKVDMTNKKINIVKNITFEMRGWLTNYYAKLFPRHKVNVTQGYNYDSPKLIPKDIFDMDSE
jgi:hypothetical protein